MIGSPYSGEALRRSGLHFLSGRAISGLLSFAVLLTLVRILPARDYGVYATLLAWMELSVAIAGLGIPWIGSRFIPEYRLHASGALLSRFCGRLLSWVSASLALTVLLMGTILPYYLRQADLEAYVPAALLFLIAILSDGLTRLATGSVLDPLMQQKLIRTVVALRQACFLSGLLVLVATHPTVALMQVVIVEVVAAVISVAVLLFGLRRHLAATLERAGSSGWTAPTTHTMWRAGLPMYGSYLLTLLYSPQLLITLVTRMLGAEAAAVFGFLRALYGQAAKYLPATLLMSLLRPRLIAGYMTNGDAEELNRSANLAGKISLFVLMPLIAYIAATGESLVGWLSGGRMPETGGLFLGLALALIPLSQRHLLETVAVATGHSRLCLLASAAGILVLPAFFGGIEAGFALWSAVAAVGLGQLLFNGTVVAGLRRVIGYRIDALGSLKLALGSTIACVVGVLLSVKGVESLPLSLGVQALAVLSSFLAAAVWLKPFDSAERARLNGFLKRRVF